MNLRMPEPSSRSKARLPDPKWLRVVAVVLLVWAAALGMWWHNLSSRQSGSSSVAVSRATPAPGTSPQAVATSLRLAQATPVTSPLARQAGELVREQDWLALATSFDERRALADIAELASDKYGGRAVGSHGGKLAAEWIAARFADYGLQPAGDNGTYFQEFPVPYAELTAMPSFELVDEAGNRLKEYRFRRDYTIVLGGYADGGSAEGPLLWVSNGGHDDYDGLDAVGTVVLCRFETASNDILRQALAHGARAVLLARLEPVNFQMRRLTREGPLLPQGIPALVVGSDVVQDLLGGSGMTLDDLSIEYKSRALARRVRLEVPLRYEEHAVGRNVLAVLPACEACKAADAQGPTQTVILSGHYDHLGADPDGTVWGGANDNASGIAVLLETARLWKEQGYVPRRNVVFAAWDGEETGLWGSQYYVEHPSYPLTSTAGMLALDMVGAGTPELFVDAGGMVADQSMLAARQLHVPVQAQSMGRSDHASFVGAGVPATLYIWWDGQAPEVIYHVPADSVDRIQTAKLRAAGQVAGLVMLNLTWDQDALQELSSRRQKALVSGDVEAWMQTVDPLQEQLLEQERAWINAQLVEKPAEFTLSAAPAVVAGDVATSTVTIGQRWRSDSQPSTDSFVARWTRRDARWYYAGPAWDEVSGSHVRVEHFQQAPVAQESALAADALYLRLSRELQLTMPETLTIRLYPTDSLAHGLEATAPRHDRVPAWGPAGTIAVSSSSPLTTTLLEFALQRTGWVSSTATWLAQGLADIWTAGTPDAARQLEARHIPLLLQGDTERTLWSAQAMPAWNSVAKERQDLWAAQAWAMTRYLVQTGGESALRQPSAATGEAWRVALLQPWRAAMLGIAGTLADRSKAVLARDESAFLATVDAANPTLYQEERHWFDDLQNHPAGSFSLKGTLLSVEGGQALARINMDYRLAEAGSTAETVTWIGRFVEHNGRWLYADVDFSEERSQHFVLKYMTASQGDLAKDLLVQGERAYAQVAADLEFHPAQPIEIKFYDSSKLFRTSIYLSMPPAHGWTEPGESIKLVDVGAQQAARTIAHELSHAALFARGVQHGALHEGTGQYEAGLFDPQWQAEQVIKWRQQVYDLVRSQRATTFAMLGDWRPWQEQEPGLVYNVGWDTVTYFRQRYGRETFLTWLDLVGSAISFEDAFFRATGTALADFDAEWRESVLRGHISPQLIETARAFDGELALQHVQQLASPSWAGREAGTDGNQAAAQYIADRFREYGLQPAGDKGTYLQYLAISQTALMTSPVVTLLDEGAQTARALVYREDFSELIRGYAGSGHAKGQIVYVRDAQLDSMHLGGRVLLTQGTADSMADAQAAYEHGAAALLLATDKSPGDMALKSDCLPSLETRAIPVCLLTKDSFEALVKLGGLSQKQLKDAPPALPLPIQAEVDVRLWVTPTVQVANVLGILPGSDPQLADEVLVVGAHFDHVGSLPDGTIYPGANDDASGVGVLLEIARLWHEQGYRPRRSVLFAAWNAEEMGLLGSAYYVAHPAYALEKTRAMIQLDMVGQGRGYYITVSGDERQDASILEHIDNASRQVEGRVNLAKYEGGSDQDSFHRRGIPAVIVAWERPEYVHLPQDSSDSIDINKLQSTGRVTVLTLMSLADELPTE